MCHIKTEEVKKCGQMICVDIGFISPRNILNVRSYVGNYVYDKLGLTIQESKQPLTETVL